MFQKYNCAGMKIRNYMFREIFETFHEAGRRVYVRQILVIRRKGLFLMTMVKGRNASKENNINYLINELSYLLL